MRLTLYVLQDELLQTVALLQYNFETVLAELCAGHVPDRKHPEPLEAGVGELFEKGIVDEREPCKLELLQIREARQSFGQCDCSIVRQVRQAEVRERDRKRSQIGGVPSHAVRAATDAAAEDWASKRAIELVVI